MKTQLPHITFDPRKENRRGLEIVPIHRIFRNREQYAHDPNLPHQLKFYNLIFFSKGSGRHFIDFNWYEVTEGSVVYLAKEQVNAFELSEHLDGYCIIFTEPYFVECFSHLPNNFFQRLFDPNAQSVVNIAKDSDVWTYFHLLTEEYERKDQYNHETIIDSLFAILISKLEEIKLRNDQYPENAVKSIVFHQFTSLLKENYAVQRNAQFYADRLSISYKHLNIICKEVVHKTAKHVIDDFIILQAKRNLINSDIKSTELAYTLGFEDPTNFTKFFKKRTGSTPKTFKNAFRK